MSDDGSGGDSYGDFDKLIHLIMCSVLQLYKCKETLTIRILESDEPSLRMLMEKISEKIDFILPGITSVNSYIVSFQFSETDPIYCTDADINDFFNEDVDADVDADVDSDVDSDVDADVDADCDDDASYNEWIELMDTRLHWIRERITNLVEKLALSEEEKALCAPVLPLPAAKKVVSSETKECSNCAATDGEGVTLWGCSRCRVVFYCGKVCQTQHWKQGGHKRHCVAVSERTVGSTQSAAATDNDCSICLEEMTSDSGVTSMSCGHTLHARCLKEFSQKFGKIIKCPVCRATHRS